MNLGYGSYCYISEIVSLISKIVVPIQRLFLNTALIEHNDCKAKCIIQIFMFTISPTLQVLQDIVTGSHFRHCVAVTTLPHSLHLHLMEQGGIEGANTAGEKIFRQLEGRMKRWMKVRQIQVGILDCLASMFIVCWGWGE